MHELSIAASIVEITCEEAERQGNARVEAVHLKLGALSGVVKDALLFAWDLACDDTPLAGSRLIIEEVPVSLRCARCLCEATLDVPFDLRCSMCGSFDTEVLQGREMEVTAMEVAALELQEGP